MQKPLSDPAYSICSAAEEGNTKSACFLCMALKRHPDREEHEQSRQIWLFKVFIWFNETLKIVFKSQAGNPSILTIRKHLKFFL